MNHSKHIDDLFNHPYKIGIENVEWSMKEPRFYNKKNVVSEPDLIFCTTDSDRRIYIVEFKGNYGERHRAIEQLYVAKELVRRCFQKQQSQLLINLLFVYAKDHRYITEKVT